MKPKLALKLVPISGLVFDLHTATLLALWGGKASHVQQYKPHGVNKKNKSRNYRNATKKNRTLKTTMESKQYITRQKKKIQTKLHDSLQMDRMKT